MDNVGVLFQSKNLGREGNGDLIQKPNSCLLWKSTQGGHKELRI